MSEALVRRYFDALARLDGEAMAACYHRAATYSDPIFPDLRGERVGARWRMLAGGASDMHLDYTIVQGDERKAQVHWKARFRLGGGPVVSNDVTTTLTFWDDRIVRQVDEFDLWRWCRSSIGLAGALLVVIPPVRRAMQRRAAAQLDRWLAPRNAASRPSNDHP
jgi:ketosteroid isomerase-like protein